MTPSTMFRRAWWARPIGLACMAGVIVSGVASAQTSTVNAVSPTATLSATQTSVTVPVTLTRTGTTSILGFSVEFTLSPSSRWRVAPAASRWARS